MDQFSYEPSNHRGESFTAELWVARDPGRKGWFVWGRNPDRYGGHYVKVIAWPGQQNPHKLKRGWARKADAEQALGVIIRQAVPTAKVVRA